MLAVMTKAEIKKAVLELPVEERAEVAQAIWDSIPSEEEARLLPLYDWQREALGEALEDLERNPDSGIPVKEAMGQIRDEVSRRS